MEQPNEELTAESLKELGNKAVKDNKLSEAILHYTAAIKLDPQNHVLYSNRSFVHLLMKHYFLALTDAKETITLSPLWPKGHFRKGEVEYATSQYIDAYESYQEALRLKPQDSVILLALDNVGKQIMRQKKMDKEIPWVGAGLGIIMGVSLLVAEYVTSRALTHPLLMSFITIIMSLSGYGIARFWRAYVKGQQRSLLDAPLELLNDLGGKEEEEQENKRRTPRYTKSQARMRYRKGKS
ncbi:stress-induced-phosphoprotein 1-like [Euwallacea fornicatus]|uniref:stress-induced-phosphoprotein 1-like n=1 Tax=Euwallacea fornicatus TaxID=995702 RepID=UPI00338E473C